VPDRVLVDKTVYRFRDPERGEVVVFDRPPGAPTEDARLIKRVIGLPGDTVSGHDGSVWIGDRRLDEPYVNPTCGGTLDFPPWRVPANSYFVMGDNRCDSMDSRYFGPVSRSHLTGRAFLIVWPAGRMHWL
jgi:signal peptidase I